MRCPYPVKVIDKVHLKVIEVPCGKCSICRANRSNDWFYRIKNNFSGGLNLFVTLTYEDKYLPIVSTSNKGVDRKTLPFKLDDNSIRRFNPQIMSNLLGSVPTLYKRDLQLFFKRLKKQIYLYDKESKVFYYAIGEYGTKGLRPHYHFILNLVGLHKLGFNSIQQIIANCWKYGFTETTYLKDDQQIKYVTYYTSNFEGSGISKHIQLFQRLQTPFSLMSKGIGKDFAVKNFNFIKYNTFIYDKNGKKFRVPRYYRKKCMELMDESELNDYRSMYEKFALDSTNLLDVYNFWRKNRGYVTVSSIVLDDELYNMFIEDYQSRQRKQLDKFTKKLNKENKK